jgi:hypothetical protein
MKLRPNTVTVPQDPTKIPGNAAFDVELLGSRRNKRKET